MNENKCPVCGAHSWSYLYKSNISREVVGCDICCAALDEIDADEEDAFG
jgi:transcription elongation factor Elf1